MRNTCWTCSHFGKCRVEVKTCPDWIALEPGSVVFDIPSFAARWALKHKRWYEKLDMTILKKRQANLDAYLKGQTEHDAASKAAEAMAKTAEEGVVNGSIG